MPIDLRPTDRFAHRHIGPSPDDRQAMLDAIGADSLDALIDESLPAAIRTNRPLDLPDAITEQELLDEVTALAEDNDTDRKSVV